MREVREAGKLIEIKYYLVESVYFTGEAQWNAVNNHSHSDSDKSNSNTNNTNDGDDADTDDEDDKNNIYRGYHQANTKLFRVVLCSFGVYSRIRVFELSKDKSYSSRNRGKHHYHLLPVPSYNNNDPFQTQHLTDLCWVTITSHQDMVTVTIKIPDLEQIMQRQI